MADWFIATEGVKVVKDSVSLAPQIITALTSVGAAFGGVALTHYFTRKREERAAKKKLARERLFIGTELICLLEHFADLCSDVACEVKPVKKTGRLRNCLTSAWKVSRVTGVLYLLRCFSASATCLH
ncbi:hypothetical protein RN043_004372 [Salmonella enterica]|nr:hypothetical protein [Salmonella enterica]